MIPQLKERIDAGEIKKSPAVMLSFLDDKDEIEGIIEMALERYFG